MSFTQFRSRLSKSRHLANVFRQPVSRNFYNLLPFDILIISELHLFLACTQCILPTLIASVLGIRDKSFA